MLRIGFLFNHFTTHQVLHTAPVAFELSSTCRDTEVFVMASCERQLAMAQRIGRGWPDHRVSFEQLRMSVPDQALRTLGYRLHTGFKRRVLRANRDSLRSMDALVVPERTSAALRRMSGIKDQKLILIPHGAGDRAVGYESRNAAFDLLLVAGEKCRQRMMTEAGVPPERIHVIGYPKFDVPPVAAEPGELFAERRPIVLYNPHFNPAYSSWWKYGQAILEYFASQSEYNLIFAPHVLLRRTAPRRQLRSIERFHQLPHVHVDLGSDRCVDMSYTRLADVYLGDVSSQIYEFIIEPRPAVFLNAHGVSNWERDPNYGHWALGAVIDEPSALHRALGQPLSTELREKQQQSVRQTFHHGPGSASRLGADVIRNYLMDHQARPGTQPSPRPEHAHHELAVQ